MGFVLLGLATANVLGVSGAVLQMFSHGVIGALLFAVAGRMIYRRTHTRDLDQLSLMDLNRALPFAAFVFVIASAASMGIPGFSGFAAEITILIGVWKAFPIAVWITGAGMVLVAAFTLRALKKSFFEGGSAVQSGDVKEFAALLPLMTSADPPRTSYHSGKTRCWSADVRHSGNRNLSQVLTRPHSTRR
jgi:NADH-quinone oxidoreductase subunit M